MTSIGPSDETFDLSKAQLQIQITVADGNLILAALAELPFKVSYNVIQKIKTQADAQIAVLQLRAQPESTNNT